MDIIKLIGFILLSLAIGVLVTVALPILYLFGIGGIIVGLVYICVKYKDVDFDSDDFFK